MAKTNGRKDAIIPVIDKSSPVAELAKKGIIKEEIKKVSAESTYFVTVFVVLAIFIGLFGTAGVMAAVKKNAVPYYKTPGRITPSIDMYNNGSQIGVGVGSPLSGDKAANGTLTIKGDLKLTRTGAAPQSTQDKMYNLNGDLYWDDIKIGLWTKIPPTNSVLPDVIYLGNIGIGTYTPDAKLSVVSASTTMGTISGYNHTASFLALDLGPNESVIHYGDTGDWLIRSASSNGNVIIQDTGGNVGIGTASLSSSDRLTVNGNSNLLGNVAASGNLSVTGNITDSGNLSVSGSSSLSGDVTASNNLTVGGSITDSGNLSVTGNITDSGSLSVGGSSNFSGDVTASTTILVANKVLIGNDKILKGWAPGVEGSAGAILIKSGSVWFYIRNDSQNLNIGDGNGDKFKVNSDGTVNIKLNGNFKSLQDLINTMQTNISTLQANVASLQSRVSTLEKCKCSK